MGGSGGEYGGGSETRPRAQEEVGDLRSVRKQQVRPDVPAAYGRQRGEVRGELDDVVDESSRPQPLSLPAAELKAEGAVGAGQCGEEEWCPHAPHRATPPQPRCVRWRPHNGGAHRAGDAAVWA